MRLHRFLIEGSIGEEKNILIADSNLIHQWKNVFRFGTGTQLILFDNSGFEYLGIFALLSNLEARIKILESKDKRDVSLPEVCLYAALIKKGNYEWVIEKATELGVSQIVPIISDRSEKKGLNIARAEAIMKEASEQSGRVILPRLKEPQLLEDLLKSIKIGDEALPVPDRPREKMKNLSKNSKENMKIFSIDPKGKTLLGGSTAKFKAGDQIGVLVGPEGGWTERELELFRLNKIPIYSLGPQILRAETAVIAILSLLLLSGN